MFVDQAHQLLWLRSDLSASSASGYWQRYSKAEVRAARAWAKRQGLLVSRRGLVAEEMMQAYRRSASRDK